MEIASWLGPYAGGTEYDEGRPYISAIDGLGGPIITADHLTRDRPCSKTSISINKYMQKAVEPENDAGFPKHNYSQLNFSCYSYPSKPRLVFF